MKLQPVSPQETQAKIERFNAEVEAVQKGIERWMFSTSDTVVPRMACKFYAEAFASDDLAHATELIKLAHDTIWLFVDGWNWLSPELQDSDIWDCAVSVAIQSYQNFLSEQD